MIFAQVIARDASEAHSESCPGTQLAELEDYPQRWSLGEFAQLQVEGQDIPGWELPSASGGVDGVNGVGAPLDATSDADLGKQVGPRTVAPAQGPECLKPLTPNRRRLQP